MSDDEREKLDQILSTLSENTAALVGTREEIKGVKGRVTELSRSVVRVDECTGRHRLVADAIGGVKTEVGGVRDHVNALMTEVRDELRQIKKGTTGQAHHAISPDMLRAAAAAPAHELTPAEMEAALQSRAEERAEKRRKAITWYIGTAIGLATILGGAAVGLAKLVRTLDGVQSAITATSKESAREIRRELAAQPPKVVYVDRTPTPAPDPDPTVDPPRPGFDTKAPHTPRKAAPPKRPR